jgi:hypothetical protein
MAGNLGFAHMDEDVLDLINALVEEEHHLVGKEGYQQ